MRGLLEDLLTLGGIGLIVGGIALVSGPAALVAAGGLLILFARGSAIDRKVAS